MTVDRNCWLLAAAFLVISVLAAQAPDVADWQTAAGGKMAFEVASIKAAKEFAPPNFPLSAEDSYAPGGRLSATFQLDTYMTFAYKLWLTPEQRQAMLANVPKWVGVDRYEIRAQAGGDATKDQLRLMTQSLATCSGLCVRGLWVRGISRSIDQRSMWRSILGGAILPVARVTCFAIDDISNIEPMALYSKRTNQSSTVESLADKFGHASSIAMRRNPGRVGYLLIRASIFSRD
jgi:hypothetical protein